MNTPQALTRRRIITAIVVFAVMALAQGLLLLSAKPEVFPDSIDYLNAAQVFLRTGGFPALDTRTPGYPMLLSLIMLLGGIKNLTAIFIVQSLMLFLSGPLVFIIFNRAFGRFCPSLIAGATAGLSYFYIQFTPAVLSEIPAGFFFLLTLALFQDVFIEGGGVKRRRFAAAMIIAAWMGMMRAAFFFLPFVILFAWAAARWIWNKFSKQGKDEEESDQRISPFPRRAFMIFLVFQVLVTGGWILHNGIEFGTFGVTAILGGNLTNHTWAFLDDYKPQNDTERKIINRILAYRAREGHAVMAVWLEMDAMMRETGLTRAEICRVLMGINKRQIAAHPDLYLRGVHLAWRGYWSQTEFGYSSPPMRDRLMAGEGIVAGSLKWINRRILAAPWFRAGFEWKFLAAAAALMLMAWLRRRPEAFVMTLILLLAVMIEAAAASFSELGENFRYRAPHEPVLTGVVIFAIAEVVSTVARWAHCRLKISKPETS